MPLLRRHSWTAEGFIGADLRSFTPGLKRAEDTFDIVRTRRALAAIPPLSKLAQPPLGEANPLPDDDKWLGVIGRAGKGAYAAAIAVPWSETPQLALIWFYWLAPGTLNQATLHVALAQRLAAVLAAEGYQGIVAQPPPALRKQILRSTHLLPIHFEGLDAVMSAYGWSPHAPTR